MPLIALLEANATVVHSMALAQIVSACGDGKLCDNSECSKEFRQYIQTIDSERLLGFVRSCLTPAERNGYVLQDLANEIGRRLGFEVTHGLYQGNKREIGFDGLWRRSDGHVIVVEAKTTDAYRFNLDTIAGYREQLIESNTITKQSSILIVMLREDTGDLEAQVRGSRHAWDIRIISFDALEKLLRLKEHTESATEQKIGELLAPFEYTKLDRIVEIAFTAASDSEEEPSVELAPKAVAEIHQRMGPQQRTASETIEAVRKAALDAESLRLGIQLRRVSRAKYEEAVDQPSTRLVCSVSKLYADGGYWYAYHPLWEVFLNAVGNGSLILAMVDLNRYMSVPVSWMYKQRPNMWKTEDDDNLYWHIVLKPQNGHWTMSLRDPHSPVIMDEFWCELR